MDEINHEVGSGEVKRTFIQFLKSRFELDSDKAQQEEIIENVEKGVDFKGTNLWILIFAIFIASVGLSVGSTAVIIGAMLVSPLMGPIMGFGLSIGIYDFTLMKRSLRNFLFAVVISLITSTLYFIISPVSGSTAELEARTAPAIWDVLIALFGGLAGIVAQSRKDRTGTVIPGVAIATALMPPLCTAGYGLATLQPRFLFGALYLFLINAVFISLATFLIVRVLKYRHKAFVHAAVHKRVRTIMITIIIVTVTPSVIMAYNTVQKAIFENNVKNFVEKSFSKVLVSKYTTVYQYDKKEINVVIVGDSLSKDVQSVIRNQMSTYNLHKATLNIENISLWKNSGGNSHESYELSWALLNQKDSIIQSLQQKIIHNGIDTLPSFEVAREFEFVSGFKAQTAISKSIIRNDSGVIVDSVIICIVKPIGVNAPITANQEDKIAKWLKISTKTQNVKLIIEK